MAMQEDFLACMKMRMANIVGEAEAVVAAMAVQNGLRRQSGTPLNLSPEMTLWTAYCQGPCCAVRLSIPTHVAPYRCHAIYELVEDSRVRLCARRCGR